MIVWSGGQTGADRGALDAARVLGLGRGGYAPLGWRAEDGEIPEGYRVGMVESTSPSYSSRTRLNVQHSDATLVLSLAELRWGGGSATTIAVARRLGRPVRHLLVSSLDSEIGASRVREWLVDHGVRCLNVAGPRESREPGVQLAVRDALVAALSSFQKV